MLFTLKSSEWIWHTNLMRDLTFRTVGWALGSVVAARVGRAVSWPHVLAGQCRGRTCWLGSVVAARVGWTVSWPHVLAGSVVAARVGWAVPWQQWRDGLFLQLSITLLIWYVMACFCSWASPDEQSPKLAASHEEGPIIPYTHKFAFEFAPPYLILSPYTLRDMANISYAALFFSDIQLKLNISLSLFKFIFQFLNYLPQITIFKLSDYWYLHAFWPAIFTSLFTYILNYLTVLFTKLITVH